MLVSSVRDNDYEDEAEEEAKEPEEEEEESAGAGTLELQHLQVFAPNILKCLLKFLS